MEISYQIFESENLLIQKFSGVFSVEEYILFSKFLTQSKSFYSIKKVLLDFREVQFDEIPDDFEEVIEKVMFFRKKMNDRIEKKRSKVAFWVDKPAPTVIATFFQTTFTDMDYDYCSTAEKIYKILKLSKDFGPIEKIIKNLIAFDNKKTPLNS